MPIIFEGSNGGSGDVVGPASATDNAVARFDAATGKLLQNSVVTATDAGVVGGITQLNVDNLRLDGNIVSSTNANGNISLSPNGTGNVQIFGSGGTVADGKLEIDKIGLGNTAPSTLFWINFQQVTSAGRGALQFDYNYTGAGPTLNILSKLTYAGTAANPLALNARLQTIDDCNTSGTGNFGVESLFGTLSTRQITQGTKNFYGLYVLHNQGEGTGTHTGGTINQYGLKIDRFSTYTGVAAQNRWGVRTEEDIELAHVAASLKVKEGSNATMGASTLVAGTVTVSNTKVTASSRIFLTGQNSSGTHGELTISARSAGTSFTITSSSATDTRSVAWLIVEPT